MHLKLLLLFFMVAFKAHSQDFGVEYWQMRQRLLDKFVVVGDCHGCSIPASKRDVEETGQDVLCYLDESIRHIGWYIAVLASEYRLLKLQNQSTDGTVMELYYALNAILRLDRYSEFILFKEIDPTTLNSNNPSTYSINLSWDNLNKTYYKLHDSGIYPSSPSFSYMNGFMMREDVPPFFGDNFTPPCKVRHGYSFDDGWITEQGEIHKDKRPNRISQDQFFHLMIGLSFVTKYVPSTVTFNGISINQMAKSICELIMTRYDDNFFLIDPMTGQIVQGPTGESIGNSAAFSSMLAVAANKIINDVDISNQLDLLSNPFINTVALGTHTLWGPNTAIASYMVCSIADVNSAMPLHLIAISNALQHFTFNMSATILAMGATYGVENGVGYKIFGNMYNLLNDKDEAQLGYTKPEMISMLDAITCEGPHWMNYFKAFPSFSAPQSVIDDELFSHDEINLACLNSTAFQTIYASEILPWLQNQSCTNCGLFFRRVDNIIIPEFHWIESENPVWNRDNIFAQLPSEIYERSHYRGHFNALDFMLLHNIYKLSQFEGKSGFEIIPSHPSSFLQEYCGVDCTINQELPYVYQHSEDVLDCQLFYSPVQLGTVSFPFIRSSLGTMTIDQTIGPKTMNISTNIGPTLCDNNTEQITYIPKAIYYAVDGYDFSPSWDPNGDVYIDFNYLPDCQYVYHERVSNPQTTLNYNIIDHSLINNEIDFKIEQRESFEVYPNPFESTINLSYYASVEKNFTLKVLDASGKIVVNKNYLLFPKGNNEITIPLTELSNGIYNLIVEFDNTYFTKRIVKL